MLIILLVLYTWIAYREVATSSAAAAGQRDIRLAGELARITSTNSAARLRMVSRTANHPIIQRAFAAGRYEDTDSLLRMLRSPNDSAVDVVLFDADRRPVHAIGSTIDPELTSHLDSLFVTAAANDTVAVSGPLFEFNGRGHFWTVAKIHANGNVLGYAAHFRRVRTSPMTTRTLNTLIGVDNDIVFANSGDADLWVALDGSVLPSPDELVEESGYARYERDGKRYLAGLANIEGTPLNIIVETPYANTQVRAHQFLLNIGVIGLILLIVGAFIVWITTRRLTRPIVELNAAAAAISRREYDRRVDIDRHDELGDLADAFNSMAAEIQRSMRESEVSRAQADLANRSKSEFLANMSHEIRTPINAMIGYTDLMEAGVAGPVTEAQHANLDRIKVSGRHLMRLVDDLLDFARLETARLSVNKRVAAAAQAVETALTVVEPHANAKPITITKDVRADAQYIGDPQRVEQILVNLLGNAIKFTPAYGAVHIETRSSSANGAGARTLFVVEDTGLGIPADRIDTIFDPFVQGHTGYTRPHGGTGLGLSISRRLAEAMDGTLEVSSEEGTGARFTLTLPAPGQTTHTEG